MTTVYVCSPVGLVASTESCAAMGAYCLVDECVFDFPCDSATARSRCSADRQTVYTCSSRGLATYATPCPTGRTCIETTNPNDGQVSASCG